MEEHNSTSTSTSTGAPDPAATTKTTSSSSIFNNILFRNVCPTDLPAIHALERQSYPSNEAASKSQLQYRQHHAALFFRCAVYIPSSCLEEEPKKEEKGQGEGGQDREQTLLPKINDEVKDQEEIHGSSTKNDLQQQQQVQQSSSSSQAPSPSNIKGDIQVPAAAAMSTPSTIKKHKINNNTNELDSNRNSLNAIGTIIGFVTATRCHAFTEKSMKVHDPSGNLLAIHSVVIQKEYRNKGIGKAMMINYMQVIERLMEQKWIKDVENKKLSGGGGGVSLVSGGSLQSSLMSSSANAVGSSATTSISKTQVKSYIQKIVLMSKIENIPFYVKLGYQVLGKSSIVHGAEDWYDCSRQLECAEKVQLKLKEQQHLQRNRNSSLCWIVDSFAIPVDIGGKGQRLRGNSTVGVNNAELVTTASGSLSGINTNASTREGNMREGNLFNINLGGSGGGNISSGSNNAITYARGSGNPAAVVMVPNATPMSKMKRSSSYNQLQLQGETTTISSSTDASNFDPRFEDNISWMKCVAKEFNLSETAFIWKYTQPAPSIDLSSSTSSVTSSSKKTDDAASGTNTSNSTGNSIHYNIRYYTCNGTEIDLCGHATLAASSVIFQRLAKEGINNNNNNNQSSSKGNNNIEEIIFHAKNDVSLKAKLSTINSIAKNSSSNSSSGIGGGGGNPEIGGGSSSGTHRYPRLSQQSLKIVMEFPTKKVIPYEKGTDMYSNVVAMLKESLYSQSNESTMEEFIEFIGIDDAGDDLLIELTPEGFSDVPRYIEDIPLKPMLEFCGYNRGVIICCEVSDEYHLYGETADFMSRFFGPKAGIEEDPVTGSAHCILGPYYGTKLGKSTIVGAQKSLRGGIVECQLRSDNVIRIAGAAVTTMTGNLYI